MESLEYEQLVYADGAFLRDGYGSPWLKIITSASATID